MRARRRVVRTVLGLCVVMVGLLCVLAGSAWAGFTHRYVSGFEKGAGEPFSSVQGVAVDQTSGDVYVYDSGANGGAGALYKFNATGGPAGFSGIAGEPNVIEGVGGAGEGEGEIAVDDSAGPAKGDIYVAANRVVQVYGADGSLLGTLSPASGWGKACGVAVDPSGSVYVAYMAVGTSRVARYAPSANPVSAGDFTGALWGLSSTCQLAVDSSGSVYAVSWPEGAVNRYEALQFSTVEMQASGSQIAEGRAVAADPANDQLHAASYSQVSQYEANGGGLVASFAGEGEGSFGNVHGLAVKGSTGDVYIADDEKGRIAVYGPLVALPDVSTGPASNVTMTSAQLNGTVNPNGLEITSCQFEYAGQTIPCSPSPGSGSEPVQVSAQITGLTPGSGYSYRLVATDENGTIYGQEQSFTTLSAPTIDEQWATNISDSTATVNAKINPKGEATTYQVEYGTDTSYGSKIPVSPEAIGSSTTDVTVSQNLTGLQAETTYHYRFTATNPNGTTTGPDKTLTTFANPVTVSDSCPNAQLRSLQAAAYLPDCRAYEMVSPIDKDGGNISNVPFDTRSSVDGNAVQYASATAFGDAYGTGSVATEYIAERGSEGWASHAITPPQKPPGGIPTGTWMARYDGEFSSDLNKGVLYAIAPVTNEDSSVANVNNLYLRTDLLSAGHGSYRLLSGCAVCAEPIPAPENLFAPGYPALAGASEDFSHVIFESGYNLAPGATGSGSKLYESVNGMVRLAGILPDSACSTPPCYAEESKAGAGAEVGEFGVGTYTTNTISANGSRIVFVASPIVDAQSAYGLHGYAGDLYLRENGATTVQVNGSERTDCADHNPCSGAPEPDPNGHQPAMFLGASRDDSKIFFMTTEGLVDEDTEPGFNIYRYEVNASNGHHLTVVPRAGSVPPRYVADVSNDGSFVYFISFEGGGPKELYVWHEGTVRHIATDTGSASINWGEEGTTNGDNPDEFRMSGDGKHVVFVSSSPAIAQSVGYDNSGPCSYGYCSEVYLYSYDANKLACVSCMPDGERPTGDAKIATNSQDTTLVLVTQHLTRAVTDDGSIVFFDTSDPLVRQDTNGKRDVYEYAASTGKVALISSGRSGEDSLFTEASPNGEDVFFTTAEQLVRQEIDGNFDLYDARVDGGIAAQNVASPAQCEGDDCQGPAKGAPAFSLPSSVTFEGQGNLTNPASRSVGRRTRSLTRAQRLKLALRACRKKHGHRRTVCERHAKRRFGVAKHSMAGNASGR